MNGPYEAEGPTTTQTEADDRFVHGLLAFLHHDGRAAQEVRVGRALGAISRSTAEPVGVAGRRLVRWRAGAVAAVCVAVGALFAVIGVQGEQSAQALVAAAIRASETAGDRRYEIRVVLGRQPDNGGQTIGTLDVRDGQHVLINARGPRGEKVTVGRTPAGEWAISPDGRVEKFEGGRAWPRWVQFEDSDAMLVESLDVLLKELAGSYDLKRSDGSTVSADGGGGGGADDVYRIIATRKETETTDGVVRGPEPASVELWIDRRTKVVERMELRWSPKHGEGPEGLEGWGGRGGPREMGPGGPGPGGPGRGGPEGGRPERDGSGRGGPPGRDEMRGGVGREGEGTRRGPRGERALPQPPVPRPMPPGEGGARFMDAPPRFGDDGQPPPPRLIVMQRIPAEKFPADWFEAETHNR